MSAWYIYRLDDIHPKMKWREFIRYMELFKSYHVVPLLGIIPECQSPEIEYENEKPDFWEIVRSLIDDGLAEAAQHGYQHCFHSIQNSFFRNMINVKAQSELAGLDYQEQYSKISKGRELLQQHKIYTDVFMPPSHSIDGTTIDVLISCGFTTVTDGITLYPRKHKEILFIPQQYWGPVYKHIGIRTICLHISEESDSMYDEVKKHLESGANIIRFSDSMNIHYGLFTGIADFLFSGKYLAGCYIRGKR